MVWGEKIHKKMLGSRREEGEQIHWSGEVGSGEERWIQYAVVLADALQPGGPITNTVEIAGSVLGPFTRQVVTVRPWRCYLPLVLREG